MSIRKLDESMTKSSYFVSEAPCAIATFWRRHPALWIALHLFLGTIWGAKWGIFTLSLLAILLIARVIPNTKTTIKKAHRLFPVLSITCASAMALAAALYAKQALPYPHLPKEEIEGSAYFEIKQVRHTQTPFAKSMMYVGNIRCFLDDQGHLFRNIPCHMVIKSPKNRLPATQDYLIRGKLCPKPRGVALFKPHVMRGSKQPPQWLEIKNTHSLAEYRFHLKEKFRSFLRPHICHSRSLHFLSSLATGEIDERSLTIEFNRLGLSHILAISGFHFALAAGFCLVILRPFFSRRLAAYGTLLAMTLYFLVLGPSPSILRAWVAIVLYLVAEIRGSSYNSLNALGVGLLVNLLYDPTSCTSLGFQLSFLCTAAILLLFPLCQKISCYLSPTRSLPTLRQMPLFDQHGYLLLSILRNTAALSLAVHLVTLPVCLFAMGRFPLLSLVYNLFFPFLASVSILLLLTGCLASLAYPPMGAYLHALNSSFTNWLLSLTSYAPSSVQFYIDWPSMPPTLLVSWLTLLFFIGALKKIQIKST